jgi:integrase
MERKGEKVFPFDKHFVTHKFKKFLKASGIKNFESLKLHSLRHTYASHLVMGGRGHVHGFKTARPQHSNGNRIVRPPGAGPHESLGRAP